MPNYSTLWEARDWLGMPGGMRGSGGGGGVDPIGKSHVIWVDLDLNPLITPDEISWFRAWGGGGGNLFHWNALEQIV